jgi:hypothetical protein
MLALVPDDLPWEIANSSDDGGTVTDVSVLATELDGEPAFSVRTIERPGERMNLDEVVRGILTDRASVASLAVLGLLLEAIPAGEPAAMRKAMQAASRRAADVGLKAGEWEPQPLALGDVTYALRVHRLREGYVATADLGPRVVALWGAASPVGRSFSLQPID